MVKRSAFTLIELVFAIVVIAISVFSLPMMMQVISKGIDSNIVQEAIFAAATELNQVTTAHWDENSIDVNASSSYARVIDVNNSCENNTSSNRYRLLQGHILQPLHRRCLQDNTINVAATSTNNSVYALEDTAHPAQNIFINAASTQQGYKDAYQSTLTVATNASFGSLNNDTNIKEIKVDIYTSKGKLLTSLKTYTTNIGEIDYYKRSY
ncbi:prepilin-type N-terminal cleavage/methylation domain-containing protein [Sulfurimonas sp.]